MVLATGQSCLKSQSSVRMFPYTSGLREILKMTDLARVTMVSSGRKSWQENVNLTSFPRYLEGIFLKSAVAPALRMVSVFVSVSKRKDMMASPSGGRFGLWIDASSSRTVASNGRLLAQIKNMAARTAVIPMPHNEIFAINCRRCLCQMESNSTFSNFDMSWT